MTNSVDSVEAFMRSAYYDEAKVPAYTLPDQL
jgi:hypothetical protein